MMLDLFPQGFEEVEMEGGLELAAYTTAGGEERLWQVFGPGRVTEVEPDWAERWKQFHRPIRIGDLWIGPPWEEPDTKAIPVVIDPGRAFGTGSHPTTHICRSISSSWSQGACWISGAAPVFSPSPRRASVSPR